MTTSTATELDERGLRRFDPDGHRIYWHVHVPAQSDYSRSGLVGGMCTAGDVWDQDAVISPAARPGRLRRGKYARWGSDLAALGKIEGIWTVVPGQASTWHLTVYCRAGDQVVYPHEFPAAAAGYEFLLNYLFPWLRMQGWSHEGRLECAEHREHRIQIEAALDALRVLDQVAP